MPTRIMVVDDDAALRVTLQEILMEEGLDVIAAEDGYQAIRLASESSISLIFMDIQMPGMNGVDAFLEIKEILPDCIVVMMTGFSVESLVQKALSEGAMTVLHKPIEVQQIIDILDRVVPEIVPS